MDEIDAYYYDYDVSVLLLNSEIFFAFIMENVYVLIHFFLGVRKKITTILTTISIP